MDDIKYVEYMVFVLADVDVECGLVLAAQPRHVLHWAEVILMKVPKIARLLSDEIQFRFAGGGLG